MNNMGMLPAMFNRGIGDNMGDRLTRSMFQRVDNVVWDLQSGTTGVETQNGIVTITVVHDEEGAEATPIETRVHLNNNLLEMFSMKIPAFGSHVQRAGLEIGDMICSNGNVTGWVIENPASGAVKIISVDGEVKPTLPVNIQGVGGFGGSNGGGFLVVKPMTSLFNNGDTNDGFAGVQSLLLPMMMMGNGSNIDFEQLMPFLLMTKGGNPQNMLAGMMMASIFSKK